MAVETLVDEGPLARRVWRAGVPVVTLVDDLEAGVAHPRDKAQLLVQQRPVSQLRLEADVVRPALADRELAQAEDVAALDVDLAEVGRPVLVEDLGHGDAGNDDFVELGAVAGARLLDHGGPVGLVLIDEEADLLVVGDRLVDNVQLAARHLGGEAVGQGFGHVRIGFDRDDFEPLGEVESGVLASMGADVDNQGHVHLRAVSLVDRMPLGVPTRP